MDRVKEQEGFKIRVLVQDRRDIGLGGPGFGLERNGSLSGGDLEALLGHFGQEGCDFGLHPNGITRVDRLQAAGQAMG